MNTRCEDHVDEPAASLASVIYANSIEPPIPEVEWTELVSAVAERNEAALRELFERTHRLVFTLIFRLVHDSHAAEELTLELYQGVWRKAASFEPARDSVVAWLMNQARAKSIDFLGAESSSALGQTRDRQKVIERSLQALTLDERRAIEAVYFGERSYAEVAEYSGEPVATIKTRIRTALLKLRTSLPSKEDL